ncbi:MAG: 5-deoxy-glucuronate isomerase [Planctomycetes bacterium]|nr:5-deoxy-glucuronate isomerase [Planctomycetota bacterium]
MARLIHAFDNHNQPIIPPGDPTLPRTYFNLVRLTAGERFATVVPGYETCWVLQEGSCDIEVAGHVFAGVGGRASVWDSPRADSVYATAGKWVTAVAGPDGAVIAVAGGRCADLHPPFRVRPEEVRPVEVGSLETHSRRCIYHILGAKDEGRTGNILISELYAEPGCWSGYPPHKHGEDIPAGPETWHETGFEEVYHYRFNPENGFGAQFNYGPDGSGGVWKIMGGDTFCIPNGYHPTVASPGHAAYVFTILIGHTQHSLVQNFDTEYKYLAKTLPGVQNMVDLFTGDQK